MSYTVSEENYIKAIFHLQQHGNMVTTTDVAVRLQTRPASVTDMLKKLKAKDLLLYERYHGFKLSTLGNQLALTIVRKHRLWEYFLVNNLRFGWNEVHDIAEELEHITSDLLIERLDEYLLHPRFDPHGDPIPDVNGKMEKVKQVMLSEFETGCWAKVCAVGSQSSELLDLLGHKNIAIGTILKIVQKFHFDHSIEIQLRDQPPFSISQQLAHTLFVKPQ